MCRLSSSRQHVLLFFNYLTDNKDCLPICRVKTDLQKTKEELKVTAKWVAKIIEKQCSIAKKGKRKGEKWIQPYKYGVLLSYTFSNFHFLGVITLHHTKYPEVKSKRYWKRGGTRLRSDVALQHKILIKKLRQTTVST